MAFTYHGKTALITGALAARGMNLILVARSAATLETLAQDFSALHTDLQ